MISQAGRQPIEPHQRPASDEATGRESDTALDGAEPPTHRIVAFWTSYIRIGLLVLAGEAIATDTYCLLTPRGPHRGPLIALASASAAVTLFGTRFAGRIAATSWRSRYSFGWTLVAGILLATAIRLDGGFDSPLIYLAALPIANAALGLSVWAVTACGVATVAELSAVWLADPPLRRATTEMAMFSAAVVGLIVFAIGYAAVRSRLQDAQIELESELTSLAATDALTGCLNHGAFYQRLESEIHRALRSKEPLSLLIVDVDLFKAFNDSHGHVAGDHALHEIGRRLRHVGRSFDVVGRIGGDEFAVILPATSASEAAGIAHRVATALRQPDGLTLTASVGYGELDPAEPTARRLVRDADSGLYEAKSKGRDRAAHAYGLPDVEGSIDDDPILLLANEKLMNDRLRAADRVAAEALSILDAYQSASTVGLGFVDAHFRILRVNPMLASVNGGDVEDQLGKTLAEVVPALWAQLEATYRAVIEHGAQVVNLEVTGEMATDPGHPHSWLTNLYPVELAGEIIGIGIVVVDVTDRKRLAESQSALTRAVVDALANAVEMRDPYTAGHQGRVGQMAVNLAVELGIEAEEVKAIELAARIHDVGKIVVPAELLSRPGRLTEIERQLVRSHASAGADLLARSDFPSHVREMVFQHHERLDGSGYPRGLTAEHIALGSRILTVADVYDAMSSARPYRSALDPDVVIKELTDGSGTLYDPAVVAACLRLIADGRTTRVGDDAGSSVHPHVAR